jgi:hypothetical protein
MLGRGPAYSTIAIVIIFFYIKASSYQKQAMGYCTYFKYQIGEKPLRSQMRR